MDRRGRLAWIALALVGGTIAAAAVGRWLWAVSLDGPVLYGEGAVAHAALLARDRLEYEGGAAVLDGILRPIFTAANYPPLYFHLAGLGDPFVVGRVASIAATLFVAGAIAWRALASGGGRLVALALAGAWIATVPVTVWGAAVKPDLVALGLTVGSVLALSASPRRPLVAGILVALAVATKPTAALPAIALAAWCSRQGGGSLARYLGGGAAGLAAASLVLLGPGFPLAGGKVFVLHVVTWNALAWSLEQVALIALVGVATLGASLGAAVLLRAPSGPIAAYALGALGIVALGGREGATINYLLDLSAAAALALADVAPRLRAGPVAYPLAMAAQLAFATAALDPFGVVGGGSGTGAWGDPSRVAEVRALPDRPALVEDSGLLIAAGREPVVDDLFLWSRLVAAGGSFLEGDRLIGAVEQGRFATVVSEVDLERVADAPAYERQRWHPALVRAVLDRYALERSTGKLWVYRPR